MAYYALARGQGLAVDVSYDPDTGAVDGAQSVNNSGQDAWVRFTLTDATVLEEVYGPGTHYLPFPEGAVHLALDEYDEPTWTGLASIETRVPA